MKPRISLVDIDSEPADLQRVIIPLSVDRTSQVNWFQFSPAQTAIGFYIISAPTTGTLKIHLRNPHADGIDLTIIGKWPSLFNTCYIENSIQTTDLTIAFLFNEFFVATLFPAAR